MRFVSLGLLVLFSAGVLLGAPADAPPLKTVHVTFSPDGDSSPIERGTVTFRALMGPQMPISTIIESAKGVTVSLPPRTMWETVVAIPGWWAAPRVVVVQDSALDFVLPLVPTSTVRGALSVPQGSSLPTGMSVKVDVPPGAAKLPGPPSADIPCNVGDDLTFTCDVPIGTLDLSIQVQDYVAVYRWGVKVAKEMPSELGTLTLSKGSAVTGFLLLANGKLEVGKAKVALFRDVAGFNAMTARLTRPVAEATNLANGFFQLASVPPGRYVLQVTYPGYAAALISSIQVYPGVESKLRKPIELQPPITLTLAIDPPKDFKGEPWRLEVVHASATGRFEGEPAYSGIAENGVVKLAGQPGGRYNIAIADSAGNAFTDEEFSTSGTGDETRVFKIDAVRIKGHLHVGDAPLSASVWFGGRFGDKHVLVHSDDAGEFHGVLPRDGRWKVSVESSSIETEVQTDVVKAAESAETNIDLDIPSNHISGVVVDQSGSPYKGALVYFANGADARFQHSDEQGRFRFAGLPPGKFTMTAEDDVKGGLKSSDVYAGELATSNGLDDVTLKLTDGTSLHGRVIGRDGPVIGAQVIVRPGDGLQQAPSSSATTGLDGVFDAHVAAGFNRALIVVSAPGYALRVFDVAVDGHAVTLNVPAIGGTLAISVAKDSNGVFVFQDDRYLAITDVIHWLNNHGEAPPTGPVLRVGDVAPGRYRICTLRSGGRSASDLTRCAEGFLAPYGELHLTMP